MKKNTEEGKKKRNEFIQKAAKRATEIPLIVMRKANSAMELALSMAKIGNVNAISDIGVASEMASASCRSASLNVRINLPSIDDEKFVKEVSKEYNEILTKIKSFHKSVNSIVSDRL